MSRKSPRVAEAPTGAVVLDRSVAWPALASLFWLTLKQLSRGRRLLVLSLLFLLPTAVEVAIRILNPGGRRDAEELAIAFTIIPHALVPLTALLYASSMIQDEVEDQTLTYLLIRPLPRWAIYLVKLLGALIVIAAITFLFTMIAYVAIFWNTPEFSSMFPIRAAKTALLLCLAQVGYCSGFGLLSLLIKRTLVVGVAYIILFEYVLASIDFIFRKFTIIYYIRVLSVRWLKLDPRDWSIDLATAPTSLECVLTLVMTGVVAAVLGAYLFATREYRMKTPEGS